MNTTEMHDANFQTTFEVDEPGVRGVVRDAQGFPIEFPLVVKAFACPDSVTFEIGCAGEVDVDAHNGQFFIPTDPGDYNVGAWVEGYAGPLVGDPVAVTVTDGAVDQDLEVAVPIVKGTILDSVGLPFGSLAQARVCLAPHDIVFGEQCTTPDVFASQGIPDGNGDYRIQVVPDGIYNVNAGVQVAAFPLAPEYLTASQTTTAELGEGDVVDLDFEVVVPGFAGKVLNRAGDPVPGFGALACVTPVQGPPAPACSPRVDAFRANGGVYRFITGSGRIAGLGAGTYFLAVFGSAGGAVVGNDGGIAGGTMTLSDSTTERWDVTWDSSIGGHVVAADGVTPVDNAAISFRVGGNTGNAGAVTFTGAGGNFTTPDLPVGVFDLTIFKPGHPSVRVDDVVVGSSDDVDLGTIVLEPPGPLPLALVPDEGVPGALFTARFNCSGLATATMTDADENVVTYAVVEGQTSGVLLSVPGNTPPGEYTVVGVCNQNYDGYDGYNGYNGYDGYNGYGGYNCYGGYNGYDGYTGYSGYGCVVHYGPATFTVLEPPVLEVSPHAGLIGGQEVDVSGSEFRPDQPVTLYQCVGMVIPGTTTAPCNHTDQIQTTVDGSGDFGPLAFTVHQPLPASNQANQEYDCTAVQCIIVASQAFAFFDVQSLAFDPNGIGDEVEGDVPPGCPTCDIGDGNGDHIPDSEQPNVASLPNAVDGDYVTIETGNEDLALVNVTAVEVPGGAPATPNNETLPIGLLSFEVRGAPAPPATADVTIHLPDDVSFDTYLKLHADTWYDITDHVTFDSDAHTVTLHLTDGLVGDDDDGVVNGVIVDDGGPALGDDEPPTVECPAPTPTFILNQPSATVTAEVHDDGSGPVTPTVSQAASTASVGLHEVEFTVADHAGNEATQSCEYRVTYNFEGFAPPVNNNQPNSAKADQTVPLKWRITDYFGVGISDPASFVDVTSKSTACANLDGSDAIETYTGNSGLQYLGDGNWQFNWEVPKSYAGDCRVVRVNLADGVTTYKAEFKFK